MKPSEKKTPIENLKEQFSIPKLCQDCRRRTTNGIKKIGSFSHSRQFCYSKQVFLESVNPKICNGYKKIFSEKSEILQTSVN